MGFFDIYNVDDGMECTLNKFTHGTKMGRVVDMLESWTAVQKDLDLLEKWTDKTNELHKRKC